MSDTLLLILKYSAIVITGIFAVLGLLTEYRDKSGAVTRWGKIALFGIVLSTIIGTCTQGIESFQDQRKTLANDEANRKAEKQTQDMLHQISRAIYPIHGIHIKQFLIVYPDDRPPLSNFLKGLSNPPTDEIGTIYFERGTEFYPKPFTVTWFFFQPTIDVSVWRKDHLMSESPDLTFSVALGERAAASTSPLGGVSVHSENVTVPDDHLQLGDSIGSLEDIRDGKIRVTISIPVFINKTVLKVINDSLAKSQVLTFTLSISNHKLDAKLNPEPPNPSPEPYDFKSKMVSFVGVLEG